MATLAIYRTTIGKKVIMAVTGLILVLFVIAHMIGNLHALRGPRSSTSTVASCARSATRP
jgi:hypothetical protein